MLSIVPWLAFTTSLRLGVSVVFSTSPSCSGGPTANWLLMSITVSPSTPTVDSEAFESFFRPAAYLSSIFITTFTGVSFRSGELSTVTVFTVPIVTPCRFTAAPVFSPAEFSKYVTTVNLCVRIPSPDELVIRNSNATRMTVEISTITPTFNCDHRTSCWLGIRSPLHLVFDHVPQKLHPHGVPSAATLLQLKHLARI